LRNAIRKRNSARAFAQHGRFDGARFGKVGANPRRHVDYSRIYAANFDWLHLSKKKEDSRKKKK
jgi:hypothetical protein